MEAPQLQALLTAKGAIVAGWILLALAVEQWRPAAPAPIHLAGYGAAWFKRWGRNLGFFILNAALSSLFVLPVTIWAAIHARAMRSARLLGSVDGMARAALGFGRASPERGAADPTLIAMLESVLAPIWVWLLLGETPTPYGLVGGAIVLGAVAALTLASARRRPLPVTQPAA